MKKKYDYIIVGAGLYGSVMAYELYKKGFTCLVLEQRDHIGGNIYTEKVENIDVHKYGAHIFHTNDVEVWTYMNQFSKFNRYINSPIANYKGKLFNLPFNMNTFYQMWQEVNSSRVKKIIAEQCSEIKGKPRNLEEQAISLVGRDIYETLIKGYTEKQWGRPCTSLPAFIIKRLPVRFTFDNNYFNDHYQGIPEEGYTAIIEKMLEDVEVKLEINYLEDKDYWNAQAETVIYSGCIDAYYKYQLGTLAYRSLRFETEILDIDNYQGNAVVNYTDSEIAYTRIIEHKHFNFGQQDKTVITREYSNEWQKGMTPFYPVNDETNTDLYLAYHKLANQEKQVIFGGRLGNYKYYNMDQIVRLALDTAHSLSSK